MIAPELYRLPLALALLSVGALVAHAQKGGDVGESLPVVLVPTGELINEPAPPDRSGGGDPSSPAAASGDRTVYFVHGLGGDEGSWGTAARTLEQEYDLDAETPDWLADQINALPLAAAALEDKLRTAEVIDPDRSFAVGHSLGGVAAREILREYDRRGTPTEQRKIKGLVTIDAPHGGSALPNKLDDVERNFQFACSSLLKGPVEAAVEDNSRFLNWIIDRLGVESSVKQVTSSLCGDLTPVVGEVLIGMMAKRAAFEIGEGSAYLRSLNAHDFGDLPSVAVHSSESEPVFWRLTTSALENPNNAEPFRYRDDNRLVIDQRRNRERYEARRQEHVDEIDRLQSNLWPWNGSRIDGQRDLANAWGAGAYWWREANNLWKSLLGARTLVPVASYYECQCPNGNKYDGKVQSDCYYQSCTPVAIFSHYDEINRPSDGYILESSQMAWGSTTYEIDNNNHLQVRNSPETGEFFREFLFNPEQEPMPEGEFFLTPSR